MKLIVRSTLSKKLKRRIQELCGFNDLEREEKVIRANEILNSTELKQAICHQILGTTFKDIDRAMRAIIEERQLTSEQQEELEIRQTMPEKYEPEFDPEIEFKLNKKAADPKKKAPAYRTLTREETAALIAASEAPFIPPPSTAPRIDYPTYSREQVQELMREHFEYQEREKKAKGVKWDSPKTTELEVKIDHIMMPSNSSKD